MEVSAPLKAYAEQKSAKLTRYYDRIQEIEVIFDNNKDAVRVEMIVNAEHRNMFIAHDSQDDAYACIDGCIDKLERQLTDHKKKFRNRKHSGGEDKRQMRQASAGAPAAAATTRASSRKRRK
jgi:putative sigma-54 modulation protein